MKNFDYLRQHDCLRRLYTLCDEAEMRQKGDPGMSVVFARNALEWVMQAFYRVEQLTDTATLAEMNLFEQMTDQRFVAYINDPEIIKRLHYIRKIGNLGAHSLTSVRPRESFFTLLNLYEVVGAMAVRFHLIDAVPPFRQELIPDQVPMHVAPTTADMPPFDALVAAVSAPGPQPIKVSRPSATDISEAETCRLFIDMMLREAGWQLLDTKGMVEAGKACIEVKLEGMPDHEGAGYADYVLFGHDGRPLAVIEAGAGISLEEGRQQAELYAQCINKRYGRMPVIYYTNGIETKVIDGLGYPPRSLYSFHSLDDLERLIQKRLRPDIREMNGQLQIAGRAYQLTAVKKVCEHFNAKHRRALLVMATGTGKTRTAASLVELLVRNRWVKNVLFLADRTALVNQAYNAFGGLLGETMEKLNENQQPTLNKRITFSTYQTVINYIDREEKRLSIGRFDLIIIDEAHRSIFGRYRSILDYFDALVVGLTATPREEVDHNSYELMELDDEPNFDYELDEAVADGYLVNYTAMERTSGILAKGIRYDDLTDDEKRQMEQVWEFESSRQRSLLSVKEEYHRDIKQSEINSYIYNIDTVDKVLQDLMETGLRVDSGERLGKSIVFAANHGHAELIVDRFNHLYPEMGSDFCRLIDYSVNDSQSLIDNFADPLKAPQIAVSVNMLDTGIDVPEVVNLVFFKVVKSKIKFIQMLGRGTRPCPNLFGEKQDKRTFYVFDWCGNIRYFGGRQSCEPSARVCSLSEKLFGTRLDLAVALQSPAWQMDDSARSLHDELKQLLRQQVAALSDSRIAVRKQMRLIHDFRQPDRWAFISPVDAQRLKSDVAPLLLPAREDIWSRKFDLLVLHRQLALVEEADDRGVAYQNKIIQLAGWLEQKNTLPQIRSKLAVIRAAQAASLGEKVSLAALERIRLELRDLIRFLPSQGMDRAFTVNIEDEVAAAAASAPVLPAVAYRQKVLEYLSEHTDHGVIQKIIQLEPLTAHDLVELETVFWKELGTKRDFDRLTGDRPFKGNIAMFVRTVTGIDRPKARALYLRFIHSSELTVQQELCLKEILDFVCINGDIQKENIRDNAPLKLRNWSRIFGSRLQGVVSLIGRLHEVIA